MLSNICHTSNYLTIGMCGLGHGAGLVLILALLAAEKGGQVTVEALGTLFQGAPALRGGLGRRQLRGRQRRMRRAGKG